ncbi:hypothetical protein [Glaciibacter superstes]|uniref:hypothetical protein n=1 Tax=Glaciibacter superstes TaxID=501023 RepID=UPI0004073CCD|nr:hypothetical protein [Glaciibacter superstes]
MRVLLKEILDCDPDAAWRAIRSPAVLREVSSPLFALESLAADGFPTLWEPGEHEVLVKGFGLVPAGRHVIRLGVSSRQHGTVRILRDTGHPGSGPLAAVTHWDHSMAISADPAGTGKTLYRDQLVFRTAPATPAAWPAFWAFWQWRMLQLKRLAPSWRFDLGADILVAPSGETDAVPSRK